MPVLPRIQWFDEHPLADPPHNSTTLAGHCQPLDDRSRAYCDCHCFDCWEAPGHNEPRCVCRYCEHRGKSAGVYPSYTCNVPPLNADDPDRWMKFNAVMEDEPDYTPVPVRDSEAYVDEATGTVVPYSRIHKSEREYGWKQYLTRRPRVIDIPFTRQHLHRSWPKRVGVDESQGSSPAP